MTKSLAELDVLVLDCQTTGANPKKGHLLEVAWCHTRAQDRRASIFSRLVALPRGASVPRRVTQLTGIRKRDLGGAVSPSQIRDKLLRHKKLPLVIHFARFEEAFLRGLLRLDARGPDFPFRIICTHEIARRLFPALPRRTLRALAGFFGHHTPDLKRATDHVAATRVIWREMVDLLDADCAVTTPEELESFLAEPPPPRSKKRVYPMDRDRRLSLPAEPGIYRLLDSKQRVLYVGKATSLRSRVNSYFQKHAGYTERNLELLSRVKDVAVSPTASALEAALLEADAIKQLAPPYNVSLKQPDPRVWFFSSDLSSRRSRPDRRHRVGPMPASADLSALRIFLKPPSKNQDLSGILGLPPGLGPPIECLSRGFGIFRKEHGLAPKGVSLAALGRLGRRLWLSRGDQDAQDQAGEDRHWTADGVARALESNVIRSTCLIRRAGWLPWLCEASLSFRLKNKPAHRLIELRAGRLTSSDEVTAGGQPVHTGPDRPTLDRQADFNAATYDRLRVLTTELRRLADEGRWIKLCLGPRICLNRFALLKVLAWI